MTWLYYENMSLVLDLTILIYTIRTVLPAKEFNMAEDGFLQDFIGAKTN